MIIYVRNFCALSRTRVAKKISVWFIFGVYIYNIFMLRWQMMDAVEVSRFKSMICARCFAVKFIETKFHSSWKKFSWKFARNKCGINSQAITIRYPNLSFQLISGLWSCQKVCDLEWTQLWKVWDGSEVWWTVSYKWIVKLSSVNSRKKEPRLKWKLLNNIKINSNHPPKLKSNFEQVPWSFSATQADNNVTYKHMTLKI